MTKLHFSVVAILVAMVVPAVQAVQVPLGPANVIGGSGSYAGTYNSGQFNATLVLDKQTGSMGESNNVGGDADGGYWLNPDNGPANAYIVIDLGAPRQLGTIELFNTHNWQFNDRGTGQFTITAGNSVTNLGANGFDLTGSTALLVSGTLLPETQANDPLNVQSFQVSNAGAYRYVRFNPLSVSSGGASCCGANNYGLNEIRFFVIPEPSVLLLSLVGAGSLVMRRRRA